LWVPVVEKTCAERTAVFGDGLVRADELVDLRGLCVVEEDGGEVRGQFTSGRDVGCKESKKRALVFLVSNDKRYFCVFARRDEELR
jgi:hypothetical protein